MTRKICPSLLLFNFSSPSRRLIELPTPVRSGSACSFDPFSSSRSREVKELQSRPLSLGMLIKTLLLLLLLLPSLSLLLSRPERVPHEKSCQMAICGVFEPYLRPNILFVQKLCISSFYTKVKVQFLIKIRDNLLRKLLITVIIFQSILSIPIIGFQMLHRLRILRIYKIFLYSFLLGDIAPFK